MIGRVSARGVHLRGRQGTAARLRIHESTSMPTEMLFYQKVEPLSRDRHRNWSLHVDNNYSFARHVNSVPLTCSEFGDAATSIPIVFADSGDTSMPAALLGINQNANAFIDAEGHWKGAYIPDFIKRYPFVFSQSQEHRPHVTLCMDEDFEGFNQRGEGHPLFEPSGEQSAYVKEVLQFLDHFHSDYERTRTMMEYLENLNLLHPGEVRVKNSHGNEILLTGFSSVNRNEIMKLSNEVLSDLVRTGVYDLLCYHWLSLRNMAVFAKQ